MSGETEQDEAIWITGHFVILSLDQGLSGIRCINLKATIQYADKLKQNTIIVSFWHIYSWRDQGLATPEIVLYHINYILSFL